MNKTSANPKAKSSKGCFLYAIICFVILPFLLIFSVLGIFVARDQSAKGQLEDEKQRLTAAGYPVDDKSLSSYYDEKASTEYAEEWQEILAAATNDGLDKTTQNIPVLGSKGGEIPESIADDPAIGSLEDATDETGQEDDWEEEPEVWDQAATRKFLKDNQTLCEKIKAASLRQLEPDARPVRFPMEMQSYDTLLSHSQNLRQVARILIVEGQMAVYDRDAENTSVCIKSLVGCATVVQGDPFLISQLVRIAIEAMGIDLLKRAIKQDVLTEKELEELLTILRGKTQVSDTWQLAMNGELATALPVFSGESTAMPTRMPFRNNDAVFYVEQNRRAFNAERSSLDSFRADLAEQEAIFQSKATGNLFEKFDLMLSGLFAPATTTIGDAFVREAMSHRIATLAIATRLYEMRNGEFPVELGELSTLELEGGPIDPEQLRPAGKKPFGYKVDGESAFLWGFSVRTTEETPEEMPTSASPPDPMSPTVPDENLDWIWEISTNVGSTAKSE